MYVIQNDGARDLVLSLPLSLPCSGLGTIVAQDLSI